jgi:5-methyltetrahydrofolate--homocysteine methyltransferase
MAAASGMTSAITNPLSEEIRRAVLAADVLLGHDPDCTTWIGRAREGAAPSADGAAAGRRRGGREGRRAGREGARRPAAVAEGSEEPGTGAPEDREP